MIYNKKKSECKKRQVKKHDYALSRTASISARLDQTLI